MQKQPGQLSRQSMRLLISGSWVRAPRWATSFYRVHSKDLATDGNVFHKKWTAIDLVLLTKFHFDSSRIVDFYQQSLLNPVCFLILPFELVSVEKETTIFFQAHYGNHHYDEKNRDIVSKLDSTSFINPRQYSGKYPRLSRGRPGFNSPSGRIFLLCIKSMLQLQ